VPCGFGCSQGHACRSRIAATAVLACHRLAMLGTVKPSQPPVVHSQCSATRAAVPQVSRNLRNSCLSPETMPGIA
jgi:hypothetical protein